MLIVTPSYQLGLSRQNGTISDLFDRTRKTLLTRGQAGCLWGVEFATGQTSGGCAAQQAGADPFTYRWDQKSATLTLTYPETADPSVATTVAITAARTHLDLRATVENDSQATVSRVYFPADLLASTATVRAGYTPTYLPGLKIHPGFFVGTAPAVWTYPSRWAFADYLGFDARASSLAIYSVDPAPSPIAPVEIGFVRAPAPGSCSGPVFCVRHAFDTWVARGDSWTSPVVRIQVGETTEQSILAYRNDNGIDAYPSLADKLGLRLPALAEAPLVKADLRRVPRFADWGGELARLPSPALIHPVAFPKGGFDVSDPDALPPDPQFGTTDDFRAAVDRAHSLGQLVMPYLNASWWSVGSPTLAALPDGLEPADVSVLNAAGTPRIDTYGDRAGYVVSPFAPFVRDRLAKLVDQWRTDVPADCLFFDQIGARPWLRDFNPAAPSPLAYDDGWISLLSPYADRCVMVEDGWDRLAQFASGFHGGLLEIDREFQEPDERYGPTNWEPYPLADWLFHDKVLLYQHDLYEGSMTADPETLTFDVAFGFMLSYAWDDRDGSLASPWLDVAGSFQHTLGPEYAGRTLTSFGTVAPGVTRTAFGDFSVVANWSQAGGYAVGGDTVAPGGFLARSDDGSVEAGSFQGSFGGVQLSPGAHYLVVQRTASSVVVHQPLGAATQLAVDLPAGWTRGTALRATAAAGDGPDATVEGTVENGRFVFQCLGPQAGQPAPTYRITIGAG